MQIVALHRKLLEVLRRFDAATRKRLRLFLISPYFNPAGNSELILLLYDRIVEHDANEEHPALAKNVVAEDLFPDRPFVPNTKGPIDGLASELFRLVRVFLGQQEMERDYGDFYQGLASTRFYRKYGMEERFWQAMDSLRKMQAQSAMLDAAHYFRQFRIEEEENLFKGIHNSFSDDMNLVAVHRNLDLYYSVIKMELMCAWEHQNQAASLLSTIDPEMARSVLLATRNAGPLDVPLNRAYRLILLILREPENREAFQALEAWIDAHGRQISREKLNDIQAYRRLYLINRYHKSGEPSARYQVFQIYKQHLEQGYLYIEQKIPHTTFRNLIIFALKLGEFDWVHNFLLQYTPEAIGGTRYPAEIHSLNTAEYHFYLKEYDKALDTIVYRLFENPTHGILADLLLVKIYYDTQSDLLGSRMKALDQKVRRSGQSDAMKARYLNFLRKLDKIIKYGWQKRSDKKDKLIEEIRSTPEIVAREWLLEKLNAP